VGVLAAHGPHHRDGGPRNLGCLEQPHRKTRDYVAFGPFQFNRHQYDDALQALSAVIGSDADGRRA
jgi:hypothetical protein